MTLLSTVTVCDHPLVQHHLARLRHKETTPEQFRITLSRLGLFLMMRATDDLPTSPVVVETPLTQATCYALSPETPILIVPILRAGLSLSDLALEMMPTASVYHIGLYRDETTLQPVVYYNKLPLNIDYGSARIFILDPMLATGGSASAAIEILQQCGAKPEHIRFVSLVAAPEGIEYLTQRHPKVCIFTSVVDQGLNEKGYIVPGLGDAGDRTFGTVVG
jgi:uracil phosphoribosyltransferase